MLYNQPSYSEDAITWICPGNYALKRKGLYQLGFLNGIDMLKVVLCLAGSFQTLRSCIWMEAPAEQFNKHQSASFAIWKLVYLFNVCGDAIE